MAAEIIVEQKIPVCIDVYIGQAISGETGPKGDKGDKGEKGDKGDIGLTGPKGDKGDVGPQGDTGPKGDPGRDGIDGINGEQGPQGERGEDGQPGERGEQGIPGPRGEQGIQGVPGPQGPIGLTGPQGSQGIPGPVNISNSVTTTSSTIAASSTAVKTAYDLANTKVSRSGDTMSGPLTLETNIATIIKNNAGSWLSSNQGKTSHLWGSSFSAGNYHPVYSIPSTNGRFTQGTINGELRAVYTANSIINAGTNSITTSAILLDESGNSYFPGKLDSITSVTHGDNFHRNIYGNYGLILRQDSNTFYFLVTNSGDQNGSWNSFRPFTINLTTGACNISGNATTATSLQTSRTFQVNLASTAAYGFNGTANAFPGVYGTLGVSQGGTGITSSAWFPKAYGRITTSGNLSDNSYNIKSVTVSATGTFVIVFTTPLSTNSITTVLAPNMTSGAQGRTAGYSGGDANGITVITSQNGVATTFGFSIAVFANY